MTGPAMTGETYVPVHRRILVGGSWHEEALKMPMTDPLSNAADREARNEYLSIIDEAWEVCCHAVESARESYEQMLETGRAGLEVALFESTQSHGKAVDDAWAAYKDVVAKASLATRRNVVVEARATYNERAASLRASYETAKDSAQQDYAKVVQDARSAFESALESEFAGLREAVRVAGKHIDPGDAGPVDYLGLAGAIAAQAAGSVGSDQPDGSVDASPPASLGAMDLDDGLETGVHAIDEEDDVILEGLNPE